MSSTDTTTMRLLNCPKCGLIEIPDDEPGMVVVMPDSQIPTLTAENERLTVLVEAYREWVVVFYRDAYDEDTGMPPEGIYAARTRVKGLEGSSSYWL